MVDFLTLADCKQIRSKEYRKIIRKQEKKGEKRGGKEKKKKRKKGKKAEATRVVMFYFNCR